MSASDTLGIPVLNNPKHEQLADLVLAGKTQTQSAIEVGYSPRSASTRAAEILARPDVRQYLEAKRQVLSADSADVRQQIDEELRDLAFANIQDLTRVDENGHLVPDFSAATRAQLKAVTGVSSKVSKRYDKDGNLIGTEKQSRFGFIDKARAVELLGKLHGMFKQDELKVTVDVADRLLAARRRVSLLEDGTGRE